MSEASLPLRVLVADDELGMREGCRAILEAEGFEVDTGEDGRAALDLYLARPGHALALVDLAMPRMGGLELVQALRKADPDLLIIVITAYATIETAVEATKRGADGYLPKPFTPDELLLQVSQGLQKRALSIETRRLRQERVEQLLELAFERSKSSTILACMTDGVLVANRARQVVLRNAAAAQALGEDLDFPLPAPLDGLDCPELVAALDEVLQHSGGPFIVSREARIGERSYLIHASPVSEDAGAPQGAVASLRDITELKRLEVAKSSFVSMVAHEMKAPLAAIESYLSLVLGEIGGQDPERDRKLLERCHARATSLRTMVSELLNLRAMETGKLRLTRVRLDLGPLLQEILAAWADPAALKGVALNLEGELPGPGAEVLADRDALATVLRNLVDNAVKYTPSGGHVRVRLRPEGSCLVFQVQDDGIGMTEAEQAKVFDEFYRAKNPRTAEIPGTGLGLSLVHQIVDQHQGRIRVESAFGQGSTFTVWLPLA